MKCQWCQKEMPTTQADVLCTHPDRAFCSAPEPEPQEPAGRARRELDLTQRGTQPVAPTRPRAPLRLAARPPEPKPVPADVQTGNEPPAGVQAPQRPWRKDTQQELADELTHALNEGERILVMTFSANDVDGVTLRTAVFQREKPRVSWLEFLASLQTKLSEWFAKGFQK